MDVTEKPQAIDANFLSEKAQEPGFVLLREGPLWRLYRRPCQVLVANDAPTLANCLTSLEEHVRANGEAVGFLSYEAGYALEPRLYPLLAKYRGHLSWFGLYPKPRLLDLSFSQDDAEEVVHNAALTITKEQYCRRLDAIHELIAAGEVYQINFTDRVSFHPKCDPWRLFTTFCRRHPVPYAAFVNTGTEQVVSLSPELFFRIEGKHMVLKPMKGTAPRGLTLDDDKLCASRLQACDKNRAENVMIVDLMRSDLGRICRVGSVKTTKLFEVERFPSVWQMTSTIEGDLCDGCTVDGIVRALFPSGSVTGAPKIRAMEHIAQLEQSERGVYTGAIGYFAPDRAQFNVAIRTAIVRGNKGLMGVGGGITYDSSAAAEWEECKWKAAFLTRSVPDFKIVETLRWETGYRLLEEHLARLRASAEYFGFRFDEGAIRSALQDLADRLSAQPQRVRILLARDSRLEIQHTDLGTERFGRVRISSRRVSSSDHFLYHKTTHRQTFDHELAAARRARCDDALFFNERQELTESAIHNVFVAKAGFLSTPPVECGLLPGTYRAHILKNFPNAVEAVLTVDDLIGADRIYLCNSVRGIFPVELVRETHSGRRPRAKKDFGPRLRAGLR